MKKYITIIAAIIAAVTITITNAELTTKQFVEVKNWANARGYVYNGTAKSFGMEYFDFVNRSTEIHCIAPISSDTADEAINALIASAVMFRIGAVAVAETAAAVTAEPVVKTAALPETVSPGGIPVAVVNRIRARAEADYPNDYSMQQHRIKSEVNAYLDLHRSE